ncbi:ISKra4 family transposase, partial [Streptomyces violascens]|uniref:ISKra4 family transposase n=1 Tax=Streptomyces violascens TaxID=67381 RepID=UPI0036CE7301
MADPFARAVSFFTQLISDLSGPAMLALPHRDVEEMAAVRGRELARLLLQAHLDLRARREEAELTALDTCSRAALAGGRTRLERGHHRELATVIGTVRVTRCALRSPGRTSCYPADKVLGLPHERHSHGVRRLAVLEAVRGSYDTAMEAITRACGKVVGKRQVEHLVQAAAVDVAAFYAGRTPTPASAATLLVLSVDGKGIVMRPGHLREATRKAAERAKRTFRTRLAIGEKTGRQRMATLAAVYDADPAVRRPHDVIAPPGGRSTSRIPRSGPKAQAKWLAGSVEHDPEYVIAAAFDQAQARDPQHRRCWVVLVDGARHPLDLIQAEAERRGWIAVKAARILRGCAHQAAAEIRAEADHHKLTGDQRTAADKACHYLNNNADFVHYDRALAAGWPIASGVIEGAARHLIADRLGITGSRWSVPGAEALLILR